MSSELFIIVLINFFNHLNYSIIYIVLHLHFESFIIIKIIIIIIIIIIINRLRDKAMEGILFSSVLS